MKRVAAIDIGTNSVRLLVADLEGSSIIMPVCTDLVTTRLGQGMEERKLLPEAVHRTIVAISHFRSIAIQQSASIVVAAATSAVRDAENKDWFVRKVLQETGIQVQVLTGTQEAYLSYLGVTVGLGAGVDDALVIDIGGGSTEFTWSHDNQIVCRSVPAGAVRMTEGGHDEQAIENVLGEAIHEVKDETIREIIGVGGTVTTLAAMDMALEVYDRNKVHNYVLSMDRIRSLFEKLVEAGPEGRKRMPGLQAARSDIIVAGVQILLMIMRGLHFNQIRVSEADLLYGLVLEAPNLSKQK